MKPGQAHCITHYVIDPLLLDQPQRMNAYRCQQHYFEVARIALEKKFKVDESLSSLAEPISLYLVSATYTFNQDVKANAKITIYSKFSYVRGLTIQSEHHMQNNQLILGTANFEHVFIKHIAQSTKPIKPLEAFLKQL